MKGTTQVRLLVHFWAEKADYDAGEKPFHIGQFRISRNPGRRVVTDARGWLKAADGTYVDPKTLAPGDLVSWEYEDFEIDFAGICREIIEARGQKAIRLGQNSEEDNRVTPLEVDDSDPLGMVAKVAALRRATFDVTTVKAVQDE